MLTDDRIISDAIYVVHFAYLESNQLLYGVNTPSIDLRYYTPYT